MNNSMLTTVMVERFQKMNWGADRSAIHALKVGAEIHFSVKGNNNIHNHVRRLNDAYVGLRAWTMERRGETKVVKRIK